MASHGQASSLVIARNSDEGGCPPRETALRISEIELMKTLNIWRIEEGRITPVLVLFRRTIGCTASEKKH
jgi:hypothetical protein